MDGINGRARGQGTKNGAGLNGRCAPTAAAARAILGQCAGFVRMLDDASYVRPSARMFGSTVGQHVRHALDHFGAVCAGLDGVTIAYDHRARGTSVETSRAAAIEMIERLMGRLGAVDEGASGMEVRVRVMLSAGGDEAELSSTLGRELAFAAHHAVHHHAMMASLGEEMGVRAPQGFGKAPATLAHESAGAHG